MALSVKSGTFSTGTGAAASTTAVTGLGFQPKVLILHWNGRTSTTDAVGRLTHDVGWGLVAGSGSQRSATHRSVDAQAASVGAIYLTDANCICVVDDAGAASGLMALQSFDSGGFTLVVNDAMPASFTVSYLAIGGSDIAAAVTGTKTLAGSTTGNTSVTGLAFQPDVVFFLSTADGTTVPAGLADRSGLAFGAAISAAKQAVWGGSQDDGSASMDTGAYIYDGECINVASTTTPTSQNTRAAFVSLDAGGFTVNVLEQAGGARHVFYLAIDGGRWDVSGITTLTDTVTDIVVSGLAAAPAGGLVVSANRAKSTQDTGTTPYNLSYGVFDSVSSRSALGVIDRHGTADSEVTTCAEFDAVYANIDTASAIQGLMDVKSMDANGVTFIMDDADPAGCYAFVVTVMPNAATAPKVPPRNINQAVQRAASW